MIKKGIAFYNYVQKTHHQVNIFNHFNNKHIEKV
jgi:hypothetical protein